MEKYKSKLQEVSEEVEDAIEELASILKEKNVSFKIIGNDTFQIMKGKYPIKIKVLGWWR